MDELDRRILVEIQKDFPLARDPYAAIADSLGSEADDIHRRVRSLMRAGIIRRIAPSYDSRALGFQTTLVAARVPADRLDEVAGLVGSLPEVTHCYERTNERNLWFTLVARDEHRIGEILDGLSRKTGIDFEEFPAERVYKIDVKFHPPREAGRP